MKFKGTLIVVKDCNEALKFYQDMFGFELIRDHDGNMELSGNLYLQEEKYWERFTGRRVIPQSNHTELYFEEPELDSFVKKLERLPKKKLLSAVPWQVVLGKKKPCWKWAFSTQA